VYRGMVKLVAQPGRRFELVEFLRWDADVAQSDEPGTLRFDVWEVPDEADAVYLYEAYVDRAALEVHKASEPFRKFVAEIVPSLIEPPLFVVPFAESTVSIVDD
jgi:quinol monooxygenase YgiN